MREQRSGRIVVFTSAAGLEGRGGTSNYAAAKMGVVGLTKSVAMDMVRYGVNVNCVAPRAQTRLSHHVAADRPDFAIPLDPSRIGNPADVAPLAAYLASERCSVTGRVFFAMGSSVGVYPDFIPHRVYRGEGALDVPTIAQAIEGYLTSSVVEL
jgi:NAD(P)-dependent dehydrogenase (short-subunit alcohol dehydrogenase family)